MNGATIVVLLWQQYGNTIILFEAGPSIIHELVVIDELVLATILGLSNTLTESVEPSGD